MASIIPLYQKAGVIIIPQTAGPDAISPTVPANLGSDGAVDGKSSPTGSQPIRADRETLCWSTYLRLGCSPLMLTASRPR